MIKNPVDGKGKSCLLFFCIAGLICSCATMQKTSEPILFQRSFENASVAQVYNSCIEAFQIREIPSLSFDQNKQRISTDWIYFKKPGMSVRFRYRFDLNISEFFLMVFTGSRGWKELVAVSILSTLGIYFFFQKVFQVQLPAGNLF